jgi:ligand-binding sensor domain-containing protein
VYRFDGMQFVSWSSLAGRKLPSNNVHDVFGARDGSLWIGTNSGLLQWVNQRSTTYLDGEVADQILQDKKGEIWFTYSKPGGSLNPICRVSGADVRCYSYGPEGAHLSSQVSLAEDAAGNLWVGHDTAFVRWRPGSLKIFLPAALHAHQGINGVGDFAAAADGSVWVGMIAAGHEGGLQHVVDGRLKPFIAPKLNGETLRVSALSIDRQNNLWVGTIDRGIYRIHNGDVDHFGAADGLSGDCVNQFFEDREGNLWVATSKGIDMLRDLPVITFSRSEGISSDSV